MTHTLHLGDCLEVMPTMPDDSVDTIITDPPYGLDFMGKQWDHGVPGVEFWKQALRVAKPGAMLMAFGGTRTYHRLACAIEDAGWIIRDQIQWLYGSGFPKSLDIGKAVDKMDATGARLARRYKFTGWVRSHGVTAQQINTTLLASDMGRHYTDVLPTGKQPSIMTREHLEACRHLFVDVPEWVEDMADQRTVESENFKRREVVETKHDTGKRNIDILGTEAQDYDITAPATEAAKKWDGYGTALKPAHEPICLAMKPLDGTFAENVLKWGVGGLWIDGGRVGTSDAPRGSGNNLGYHGGGSGTGGNITPPKGRFPANLIHDGSPEVLEVFPETGKSTPHYRGAAINSRMFASPEYESSVRGHDDNGGSAARFFYCAKASKSERNAGLESLPVTQTIGGGGMNNPEIAGAYGSVKAPARNSHPTVKPLALMQYLCRLTRMPDGGVVLDPFSGSGTTGVAAVREGREYIGIEKNGGYLNIQRQRIEEEERRLF